MFPKQDIEWMQVDAIPGARWGNGTLGTDNHRKFLGLHNRGFKFSEIDIRKDILGNARITNKPEIEVLTNYNYGRPNQNGLRYCIGTPEEKVGRNSQNLRGYGKEGEYILEPIFDGNLFNSELEATPLEINVHVTVKMKGSDKIYSYNRAYLPELKYRIGTEQSLVDLYKNVIQKRTFDSYYNGHQGTYNYNVKRAYDKIKFYFPNADITYEEK